MNNKDITKYLKNFNKTFNNKCNFEYTPSILGKKERIIVLGDIHGDFSKLKQLLRIAKVINQEGNWIGGNTVVVQVGDQIDSCRFDGTNSCSLKGTTVNDKAEDIIILKYLTELHNQAIEYNGAVYSLVGNHEIMNVQGDMTYVSYENLREFDDVYGRMIAFRPGNEMASFMGCTRKMALIIGSNLFVHAGILPELIEKYGKESIDNMNKLLSLYLLNELENPKHFEDIFLLGQDSPLWTREFGGKKYNKKMMKAMDKLEKVYKVGKMFVGHTPQMNEGINRKYAVKIWRTYIGVIH